MIKNIKTMSKIRNKKWYEENTQMDRHWAYRKEFMSEDMTDVTEDKKREEMDDYFKKLEKLRLQLLQYLTYMNYEKGINIV